MYMYIAHRNLKDHYHYNSGCGGVPYNNDYKFTAVKDGMYYLLTRYNENYAVSKEAGEKFIEDVVSKCTGDHQGSFPFAPSYNGKEIAAVVELEREVETERGSFRRDFYFDMDEAVLFQMLEELRAGSGEPLDARGLINYCYPNAVLPEEDFDLKRIYYGLYCKEEPVPAGVIQMYHPDKKASSFWANDDGLHVEIREEDKEIVYSIPAELLPWIKEQVRQLCKEPAEAYVEHGDPEGFIRFGKDEERIFTDPDKTLALLKEIASKGEKTSEKEVDKSRFYPVRGVQNGPMTGFAGMFGFPSMAQQQAQAQTQPQPQAASDGKKCTFCGADVRGQKFCPECGGKVE